MTETAMIWIDTTRVKIDEDTEYSEDYMGIEDGLIILGTQTHNHVGTLVIIEKVEL